MVQVVVVTIVAIFGAPTLFNATAIPVGPRKDRRRIARQNILSTSNAGARDTSRRPVFQSLHPEPVSGDSTLSRIIQISVRHLRLILHWPENPRLVVLEIVETLSTPSRSALIPALDLHIQLDSNRIVRFLV